jgi:hypothetical protein
MDENATRGGVRQSFLDFAPIKAEDGDFYAAFGPIDGLYQRCDPIAWLNQQFQVPSHVMRGNTLA